MLQSFVDKKKFEALNQVDAEKIVVHVKKDGTYQKAVEKAATKQAPPKTKK